MKERGQYLAAILYPVFILVCKLFILWNLGQSMICFHETAPMILQVSETSEDYLEDDRFDLAGQKVC